MSIASAFGILTPLLPSLGPGILLLAGFLYLSLRARWLTHNRPLWAWPFLALLATWVAVEFYWEPQPAAALLSACRYALVGMLFALFSTEESEREKYLHGLEIGAAVAAVITALLLLGDMMPVLPNRNDLWKTLGREPGTFSDPNAFGIFIVLLLPLLWGRARGARGMRRAFLILLCAAWIVLGCFSGSRTLGLGLALYALFVFWRMSRKIFVCVLLVSIGLLAALNVIVLSDPTIVERHAGWIPETAERILETSIFTNAPEAFFSRIAFWKIGIALWSDHFLYGVGLQQFSEYVVQYSARLGIPIGLWTDNANNFYIGILAELGVVGALALLLSLAQLRFKEVTSAPVGCAIGVLMILLLVGPHIDFDEVAVLVAVLMSINFETKEAPTRGTLLLPAVLVLLALAVVAKSFALQHGLYAWELEGQKYYRWTWKRAQFILECSKRGNVNFEIRALNPDIAMAPVAVTLRVPQTTHSLTQTLTDAEYQRIELRCPTLHGTSPSEGTLRVQLSVSRTWSPSAFGMGADRRDLGVQLHVAPSKLR